MIYLRISEIKTQISELCGLNSISRKKNNNISNFFGIKIVF